MYATTKEKTYIQTVSEQPLVTVGRLSWLFVPAGDDMRYTCWVGVCGSANAQYIRAGVYHHHIVTLNVLHETKKRRIIQRKEVTEIHHPPLPAV